MGTHLHDRAIERDLTRLADGTLRPTRRQRVERRIASSAELQAGLRDQRRAVAAIRAARGERAPLSVRIRARAIADDPGIEPTADGRRGFRSFPVNLRWRPRMTGLALAGALAAIVWTLSGLGGGQAGPTVAAAATVAVRPSMMLAPTSDEDDASLPSLSVAGVPFPDWEDRFGWRATGVRTDRVDGRTLTTVFYRQNDRQIAYSIVAGGPLPAGAGTRTTDRDNLDLRSFSSGAREVVTWLREGHTCVLSGVGVPLSQLLELATWRAHGELPY